MAFTFCTNCGNKIEDGVQKCPYCGHIKGAERTFNYAPESWKQTAENQQNPPKSEQPLTPPPTDGNNAQSENGTQQPPQNPQYPPYGNGANSQNPQGPYGYPGQNPNAGQYGSPYGNPYGGQGQNPYGQNPYGQQNPFGNQPPRGQYPLRPVPDRPMSAGLLIFSIINIIFGCCCSIGMIFGVIALVYTINARQAPNDDEEIRRKKIALVMNITAVVLTAAFIVSFAIGAASGAFSAM